MYKYYVTPFFGCAACIDNTETKMQNLNVVSRVSSLILCMYLKMGKSIHRNCACV